MNTHQIDEAIDRIVERTVPEGVAYEGIDPEDLSSRVQAATADEARAVVDAVAALEQAVKREAHRAIAQIIGEDTGGATGADRSRD